MNIISFKDHIVELFADLGYNVWFGTKSRYNLKKQIGLKEIIIEPFQIPLADDDATYIRTTINIWIGIRRDIDIKFINDDGDDIHFLNYMLIESNKIYDKLQSDSKILITETKQNINTSYFEANSSTTVNSQSFIRFSIPVKIYEFNK